MLSKIFKIILLIFAIIGILFLSLIAYYLIYPDQYFEFRFSSEENNNPINGKVYLDGIYLGKTKEGILKVNTLNLSTGTLKLTGLHNGMPFELYFDFKGEWIQNREQRFTASSQDFIDASFNATNLDLRKIEKQIFDMVNLEREKYPKAGIRSLRWNDKISTIAKQHSEDMQKKKYVSHRTLKDNKTLESTDFSKRLKNAKIFYIISNENIIFLPVYPKTDIARESIKGWLDSPGHRSTLLDLDNLYTDAGVGIACEKNLCYVTMDFISLREVVETELDSNVCWLFPIYPISSPFFYDSINVKLKLSATSKVKAYITKQFAGFSCVYEELLSEGIKSSKYYGSVKNIDDQLRIYRGDSILISTDKMSKINLVIDYLTD